MTIDEAIKKAYTLATGKSARQVNKNDDKYLRLFELAQIFQGSWQNEPLMIPNQRWSSLEQVIDLGGLTESGVYQLPSSCFGLSVVAPLVYITNQNNDIYLTPVNANEIRQLPRGSDVYYYDYGQNSVILSKGLDKAYGIDYELRAKVYAKLLPIEGTSDEIKVDDPDWLVYTMAAEYIRPDIIHGAQFANLAAYANNAMTAMKNKERAYALANHSLYGGNQ